MNPRGGLLALFLLLTTAAHGATFTVSSSADAGPGTLRQAILDANASAGHDQIALAVAAVTVTSSLPQIMGPVTIDEALAGDVDVIVNGSGAPVGFDFALGSNGSTISNVDARAFGTTLLIETGVTGTVVSSGRFTGTATVNGSDSRLENTLFTTLQIHGDRNQLSGGGAVTIEVTGDDHLITAVGRSPNPIAHLHLRDAAGATITRNTFVRSSHATAIDVGDGILPVLGATFTGNSIAREFATGIAVHPLATGVRMTTNFISAAQEIDLGADGRTANDPAPDADLGANNLQNHPVVTRSAYISNPSFRIDMEGTLTSAPLTPYLIEVFATPPATPSGASTLVESFVVTTDASGTAAFARTMYAISFRGTNRIALSATNQVTNDTSELSPAGIGGQVAVVGFATDSYTVDEGAGAVHIVVQRTGYLGDSVIVGYETRDATAVAADDYQATSGTVTFAPGETMRTVVIPIIKDQLTEGAERFHVDVTSASRFTTLSTTITTVTISANATVPAIPTLSTWSLLALALGLAAVMLLRAR